MLAIYSVPISLYCAKLRIVLRHKKLEWNEQAPPGGYGSDEYKTVVASGNLPALVDGSLVIADSEAIAEYLEEKYPVPAMLPEEPRHRAKARELSRFHDTRLEPELRKLFGKLSPDKRDPQLNSAQAIQINTRLLQLSEMVEDLPPELLLGHCGYPITFAWLDLLIPLLPLEIMWPKQILNWRKKIDSFSAVSAELFDYCPKIEDWSVALGD